LFPLSPLVSLVTVMAGKRADVEPNGEPDAKRAPVTKDDAPQVRL
jgi:hypothetical protein